MNNFFNSEMNNFFNYLAKNVGTVYNMNKYVVMTNKYLIGD